MARRTPHANQPVLWTHVVRDPCRLSSAPWARWTGPWDSQVVWAHHRPPSWRRMAPTRTPKREAHHVRVCSPSKLLSLKTSLIWKLPDSSLCRQNESQLMTWLFIICSNLGHLLQLCPLPTSPTLSSDRASLPPAQPPTILDNTYSHPKHSTLSSP